MMFFFFLFVMTIKNNRDPFMTNIPGCLLPQNLQDSDEVTHIAKAYNEFNHFFYFLKGCCTLQ